MPEALSHLLDFPDVLTGATFQNIHTTHLLHHIKALDGDGDQPFSTDLGDSSIVRVRNKTANVSFESNHPQHIYASPTCSKGKVPYQRCWESFSFYNQILATWQRGRSACASCPCCSSLGVMKIRHANHLMHRGRILRRQEVSPPSLYPETHRKSQSAP
jgi:hypothetical protein